MAVPIAEVTFVVTAVRSSKSLWGRVEQEQRFLNGFSLNLILASFTKTCQYARTLHKISPQQRTLHMKTYKAFLRTHLKR
jgi:hypothetical protein